MLLPSKEEIEEMKTFSKEKDVTKIKEAMFNKINSWKSVEINCGITGSAGSGKSSFINTIRGMKGEDEGAAEVGIIEITRELTPYADPQNQKLLYWDLPGVGTTNFPKDETTLTELKFQMYDFFLIFSCCRFTEEDIWLAKQIQKLGKKFFLVRTKLDEDLRNQKRDYPKKYKESEVRSLIYKDCVKQLHNNGFENPKVFLISNCNRNMQDFPKLCIELAKSLPLLKREALTLSIHSFSEEIIAEKKKILTKYIYFASAASTIGATVPVPGASVAIDCALVIKTLRMFIKQFGLDNNCLRKHQKYLDKKTVQYITGLATKEIVFQLFKTFSKSIIAEEMARNIFPFIGSFISAGISAGTTYAMLSTELDKLEEIAIFIMKRQFKVLPEDLEVD